LSSGRTAMWQRAIRGPSELNPWAEDRCPGREPGGPRCDRACCRVILAVEQGSRPVFRAGLATLRSSMSGIVEGQVNAESAQSFHLRERPFGSALGARDSADAEPLEYLTPRPILARLARLTTGPPVPTVSQ
jgi:hypothetical protein